MTATTSDQVAAVIDRHGAELNGAGVLSVRPGWEIRDGWLTGRRAIIVTVAQKREVGVAVRLPDNIEGVPVDVRQASARKAAALEGDGGFEAVVMPPDRGGLAALSLAPRQSSPVGDQELIARSGKPRLPYTPAPGVPLTPVTAPVRVQAAASPDAGWPVLKAFLEATREQLTVGLYDFTSAHVLHTFTSALLGKQVMLVLDHPAKNPTADQSDDDTVEALRAALGDRLKQAWALEAGDPHATAAIYPSAYHIKVAVRDHEAVWLSSGNWNNSNQPDIDPVTNQADAAEARTRDRDWHLVIESTDLATLFEAYLSHDYDVAAAHNTTASSSAAPAVAWVPVPRVSTPPFQQFFPPMDTAGTITLTPLLTPDPGVYATSVLDLIRSATTTLLLQFQYINLPPTNTAENAPFRALVSAVIERQQAGVDVRVIMSEFETADYLEELQTAGLDVVHRVRLQNNVHNKGIIVDDRRVLVSSQNWSTAGTLQNRDAGLIIDSPDIAHYFGLLFEHDWAHLATTQTTDS